MIDMRSLHTDQKYIDAHLDFSSSQHPHWRTFLPAQLSVSKNKCPVCECPLDGSVTRNSKNGTETLTGSIDHYRPKSPALYPRLKYDPENYLLMCSDCNRVYKGSEFPLFNGSAHRDVLARSTSQISSEQPLIVNPIYDDIYDLFKIAFKYSFTGKKVLELIPHESTGYHYEKAKETIRLFNLGNCEQPNHSHHNSNVQLCRITLLSNHFTKFFEFMKALENRNVKKAILEKDKYNLEDYGFYKFLTKKKYKNYI